MIGLLLNKVLFGFSKLRRLSNHKNIFIRFLCKNIYRILQYENSSSISLTAKIDDSVYFPHDIKSIFISGSSIIGRNTIIFQQVTIGSNTDPESKNCGSPKIGNNVIIGSGAKIIGRVSVGNNVKIGANAVVTKDIPNNSIVVNSNKIIGNVEGEALFYTYRNGWKFYKDLEFWDVECEGKKNKLRDNFGLK